MVIGDFDTFRSSSLGLKSGIKIVPKRGGGGGEVWCTFNQYILCSFLFFFTFYFVSYYESFMPDALINSLMAYMYNKKWEE